MFLSLCFRCTRKNKWRYTFFMTHRDISAMPIHAAFCPLSAHIAGCTQTLTSAFPAEICTDATCTWNLEPQNRHRSWQALLCTATYTAPGTALTPGLYLCQAMGTEGYTQAVPCSRGSSGKSHPLHPHCCYRCSKVRLAYREWQERFRKFDWCFKIWY